MTVKTTRCSVQVSLSNGKMDLIWCPLSVTLLDAETMQSKCEQEHQKVGKRGQMRKFEKFRRVKVTAGDAPIVAIHQRGIFAMNQLAFEALGEPVAVELLFDRNNQVIGLKAAERDDPDSYVVRHHTKYSHQVEGRSFLSYYGIPKEATGRRYKAELIDRILEVDLKQDPEEALGTKGK
jgi:hypothetical protein